MSILKPELSSGHFSSSALDEIDDILKEEDDNESVQEYNSGRLVLRENNEDSHANN